jgi:hypothetical protein
LRLPSDPERGIQALAVVGTYEQRLNEEPAWALREGSEHFGGGSAVHKTLLKITRRLTELRIPYVIAGGLRDAEYGVRIEFLVSGEYPGDGKPKPVTFPDPAAGVEVEGLRFLGLVKLVELKLASGTSPGRRKDLGDVQELIRLLKLSAAFADQLHPSVRATYHELWTELQELPPS